MLVSFRTLACAAGLLAAAGHTGSASAQSSASGESSPGGQSIAETMRKWGLLGTWAVDCGQPPSAKNNYTTYVAASGGGVLKKRHTGDREDSRPVLSAAVKPKGTIQLVSDFSEYRGAGKRLLVLTKGADGRIKAISNSKTDGTGYTIKDGKFVNGFNNGREVLWQSRCHRTS